MCCHCSVGPSLMDLICRARAISLSILAGRAVREWAREVADIAAAGLPADERRFLDPVFAVLESGRSPGMGWDEAADLTPAAVLPKFEYV